MPRRPHCIRTCVTFQVATRSDANCDSPFNSSITAGAPQLRAPGSHTAADSLVYNEASWRQKRLPHNAATDGRTIQPFAVALGDAGPMSAARDAARLHPAEGLTEGDASSLKQEVGGCVGGVMERGTAGALLPLFMDGHYAFSIRQRARMGRPRGPAAAYLVCNSRSNGRKPPACRSQLLRARGTWHW